MRARRAGILLLSLVGCAAAAGALAAVKASLDVSEITSGETVQLTLEHDGQTSGQPDVTALQQDFDILGTSSSTVFQLGTGGASEKTQVVLTLAPKVSGHLTIPPLSWSGEQTRPLSLEVVGPGRAGQSGAAGAPTAAAVFMESSASPQQPYVEGAVQVTVRLFMAEPLYHAELELPESSDVVVKRLGSDASSEAERNGQNYQVVTRQYLLFPLHSGKLTLRGPVLEADVAVQQPSSMYGRDPFAGFYGGPAFGGLQTVRPVRLQGNPIVLSVQPRPPEAVGNYWLPARRVTLDAAWNPTKLSAPTGEPVTLDVDMRAIGLAAAQLPDVSSLLNLPSKLKAYPDQPKLDDSIQDGKLVGSRDQTIALIADSPGQYTIPALTVRWWDTQANQPRTATLPARTLTILPAAGSTAASAAAPTPAAQPSP
ncbi:MAG: BatD family protein, partial [Steroidobacteraceae bacterium]